MPIYPRYLKGSKNLNPHPSMMQRPVKGSWNGNIELLYDNVKYTDRKNKICCYIVNGE